MGFPFNARRGRTAAARPSAPASGDDAARWFQEESRPGARDGSYVDADWFNQVAGNLRALLVAAGITLSESDDTMVREAVKAIAGSAVTAGRASPQFTGVPTAPTASAGNQTNQLATCAFVKNAIDAHTHAAATTSAAGFMSAADKGKVDALKSASTYDVGTSGAVLGRLDQAVTYSALQTVRHSNAVSTRFVRLAAGTEDLSSGAVSIEFQMLNGSLFFGNANGTSFAWRDTSNINSTTWMRLGADSLNLYGSTLYAGTVQLTTALAPAYGGTGVTSLAALKTALGGLDRQVLHVRDEKPSGTQGGSFAANTEVVRDLNSIVRNEISGASLSASVVTLPAGRYTVMATAPVRGVSQHRLRLWDVTNGAVLLRGGTLQAHEGGLGSNRAEVFGTIALAAPTQVRIEHRCTTTQNTYGLGLPMGISGEPEIFSEAFFEKVA